MLNIYKYIAHNNDQDFEWILYYLICAFFPCIPVICLSVILYLLCIHFIKQPYLRCDFAQVPDGVCALLRVVRHDNGGLEAGEHHSLSAVGNILESRLKQTWTNKSINIYDILYSEVIKVRDQQYISVCVIIIELIQWCPKRTLCNCQMYAVWSWTDQV